jgi:hypothetical protein
MSFHLLQRSRTVELYLHSAIYIYIYIYIYIFMKWFLIQWVQRKLQLSDCCQLHALYRILIERRETMTWSLIKCRMASYLMLRRVAVVRTDVSEELSASIIRVTRMGELGTTLAVTSNRRTLRRNTKPQILLIKCSLVNLIWTPYSNDSVQELWWRWPGEWGGWDI